TLDEVMRDSHVDFIKVDVQGWELEVLRGMEGVLRKNPAVRIYLEFWPYGLRNAGCEPAELLKYLIDTGFELAEESSGELRKLYDHREFAERLTGRQFTNVYATRRQK